MSFSNQIWVTRKARINAAERLKRNDYISQVLLTYYSLFLIIITIVDMENDNMNFEILILILSIMILVLSVFTFSMNYKERSLTLKSAYIKMSKIRREVLKKEANKTSKGTPIDLSIEEQKYDDILEFTENHSMCDYIKVMHAVKDNEYYEDVNGDFTVASWTKFLFCIFRRIFFSSILFLIPMIILWFIID